MTEVLAIYVTEAQATAMWFSPQNDNRIKVNYIQYEAYIVNKSIIYDMVEGEFCLNKLALVKISNYAITC